MTAQPQGLRKKQREIPEVKQAQDPSSDHTALAGWACERAHTHCVSVQCAESPEQLTEHI